MNGIPSLPRSVVTLTSEEDTHVEPGSATKLAEESAGLSGECAPSVTSIPDVSSPAYFEDNGASLLKVDKPSAVIISAMDPKGVDEILDASAEADLSQSVTLKEEIGKNLNWFNKKFYLVHFMRNCINFL